MQHYIFTIFITITITLFLLSFLLFNYLIINSYLHYFKIENKKKNVKMLKFPYPYKAALSICSDIDGTDTLKEFLSIQEFLNTDNKTSIGPGVKLEIGNSFFPTTNTGRFALLSKNEHDKEVITELMKKGYIDFIHSFNTAKNRTEIIDILDIIKENKCKIDVWVNHSRVPCNIGSKPWCQGDNKFSKYYHSDISMGGKNGFRFVWTGDVSSILGQGVPINYRSFFLSFNFAHPIKSLYNNVVKEVIKYMLSIFSGKYANRKYNELIFPIKLKDGKKVYGFIRNNVSYRGIRSGSTIRGLADILTRRNLQRFINAEGAMIIYTHFGENNGPPYFSKEVARSLRLLAEEYNNGNIFVSTTSRILNYYANRNNLKWYIINEIGKIEIHIEKIVDPISGEYTPSIDDIQGISFKTRELNNTKIFICKREIKEVKKFKLSNRGDGVIMVPIKKLVDVNDVFKKYKMIGMF